MLNKGEGKLRARALQRRLEGRASTATVDGLPFLATVVAVSGMQVAVRSARAETDEEELIVQLAGPASIGDLGLVVPLVGGSRVFSRIDAVADTKDGRQPPYSGRYIGPHMLYGMLGTATITLTSQITFSVPIYFDRPCTLDSIWVNVVATQAGATLRLGIYDSDPLNGFASNLLVDAGTVSAATAGVKEAAINLKVKAGPLYHLAVVPNVAGVSVTNFTPARSAYYQTSGSFATNGGVQSSPATPSTALTVPSNTFVTNPPLLRVRIA